MISVLLTSELSLQRSDVIAYFTCSVISRHWEVFFSKIFHGSFFLQQLPQYSQVEQNSCERNQDILLKTRHLQQNSAHRSPYFIKQKRQG